MRYSDELIEEVRQSNDVVDIISQYVHLTRKGRNYFGLCPFHNEKSPSFSVSPDRQIFHCFGCGVGGNVYTFLMRIEGITFLESLEQLAERANIQLPTFQNGEDSAREELKAKVLKINEFTAEYYHQNLYKPTAKIAQEYVKQRKMNKETLESYRIGYSGKFDELYKALKTEGFGEKEILESNLVKKNDKGRYYDFYQNRLMIPICDIRGKVIAFGGRALEANPERKYINSPDTIVYNKGRHLFGLNVAKKDAKKRLLIVEGYMDVISLHQRGITNVVASLGTALTENQGWLLRKNTEQIILGFDADSAGQTAVNKSISILQKMGCDMRVLQIEGAKDPDEYIVKFGEGRFKMAVDNAISVVEFKVKNLKKDLNLENTSDKIKFLNQIAKILSEVQNTMEREIYIEKIAKGYNISKEAIYAEVNKLIYAGTKGEKILQSKKVEIRKAKNEENNSVIDEDLKRRENTIIALLLDVNTNIFMEIKERINPEDFKYELNRKIAIKLYEELEKQDPNINKLIDNFDDETQNHITMVMATDYEIENTEKAVEDIIQKYEREKLDIRKKEILKQLEIEEDGEKKKRLGKELSNIIITLAKIK